MAKRTRIDPTAIASLSERIRREVEDGRVPAGQMAIALNGELVHTENFGDATDDSLFNVFSCTKALIAGVVWQLIDEGVLTTETRVGELVPTFESGRDITLAQLLTHTGGFPHAPLGPPTWGTSEARLEQFRKWNLQWEPGERFEYHATSGHWIIAEMVSAVDGGDYLDSVRRRVLEPLGLKSFTLGSPDVDHGAVAELHAVGALPTPEEIEKVFGVANIDLSQIDLGEVTPEILLVFNDPAVRSVGVPGGGGIANAASLALLYQGFLNNPEDLWSPQILAEGTARVHCALPEPMNRYPANRTLGLIVAGGDGFANLRGFGYTSSPTTFGHGGAAGQLSWADPETGMSFGFCTSGVELNFLREGRRKIAINSRAAQVVQVA